MSKDPKQQARTDVRQAQSEFERANEHRERASTARRESFERAQAAGLSLAEIATVVGLHRSRVDQILHGK